MMAHQEPMTGTSLRTPRAAAAAGIVFSLLLGLALVLLIISAPSDTATEGAWLTDTSQRATIALRTKVIPGWIGMLGFAVAAVLLVSVGLTPWVELLFPAWILLLSIDILRTGLRGSRGAGGAAIGAPA
jgi:hypothetical protein